MDGDDGDLGPEVEEAAAKGWSSFQRHLQGGLLNWFAVLHTNVLFRDAATGDAMNVY